MPVEALHAGADTALQRIFVAQRAAFSAHPMPDAAQRREHLRRLKRALLQHQHSLCSAISSDFGGHSFDEVLLAEVFPLISGINQSIQRVGMWMKPARRRLHAALLPGRAQVIYQPLGVVGVIAPWNYPLLLSIGPLINILAAGNRAMLKISEFSPATTTALRAMLAEAFSEDQVAVVPDDAPDVAVAFSRLSFDHLVFTGSGKVGRKVMGAAAENLVPVTLELGGKSPVVIADDAPIAAAAERICWGKSLKSGQSCTAPDYVLCPRARVEEFVAAYRVCFGRMFPTLRDNRDLTSIINDQQYQRLLQLLADARSKGATLEELNPAQEDLAGTRKLPTVLVLNPTPDMLVLKDEIFGPILPIVPYDGIDDALTYINSRPRPLALYLFSHDRALQTRVISCTHCGGLAFNDTMTHAGIDDIPFGGIGDSGIGHYHGYEGFLTFSKAKGVFAKGRFNSSRLVYAPYGRLAQRLTLWMSLR